MTCPLFCFEGNNIFRRFQEFHCLFLAHFVAEDLAHQDLYILLSSKISNWRSQKARRNIAASPNRFNPMPNFDLLCLGSKSLSSLGSHSTTVSGQVYRASQFIVADPFCDTAFNHTNSCKFDEAVC